MAIVFQCDQLHVVTARTFVAIVNLRRCVVPRWSRIATIFAATTHVSRIGASLLPDAKARKNPPEQIVRAELAGDLRERLLRLAQLLGHELAGAVVDELSRGGLQMPLRARERIEVAAAGGDGAGVGPDEADAFL